MGMRERLAWRWKSSCVTSHDPAPVGRPDRVEEVRAGTAHIDLGCEAVALERDRHPIGLAAARAGTRRRWWWPRARAGTRARRAPAWSVRSAQASAIIMQAGPQVNSVVWWT